MSSDKLKKIEFKRMLKSYESALEDLEYLKEMASEINSEFSSALAAKKRQDLFESKEVKEMAEKKDPEEKESAARDPLFKKLFRKIVVQCHPDRMSDDLSIKQKAERLEFYELANKANDEDNMALLIVVAIKLELELGEEYMLHIKKIEEENSKIQKEIENIQGSISWKWYHTEEEKRDSILNNYIKHMEMIIMDSNKIKKKILGLGHPRTGTGYTHKILKSWGLKVGHEKMEADGIVAWQLVDQKGPWPFISRVKPDNAYKWETIIYNVRDPKTSIASIIFSENKSKQSVKFRSEKLGIDLTGNRVEAAIRSILEFDKRITAMRPSFTYRIEDQSEELFNFLKSKNYEIQWDDAYVNKKYNARKHPDLSEIEEEFNSVDRILKKRINRYCQKYGYPNLY